MRQMPKAGEGRYHPAMKRINGAAWATLVAHGVMCGLIYFQSEKIRHLSFRLLPMLAIAGASMAAWALISLTDIENPYISLIVRAGVLSIIILPLGIVLKRKFLDDTKKPLNLIDQNGKVPASAPGFTISNNGQRV